jgi:2-C-methyl-D-erythritol 4-phosphate cytidylyltransferase / 2-C-methyl-D-erythritol 2,4-cyclodiphosphate synthase
MDFKSLTACAIIVAGGVGSRAIAGSTSSVATKPVLPKQLQKLGAKPVIAWSVDAFASHPNFIGTIIVCAEAYQDMIGEFVQPNHVQFARAGDTRTASVRSGLEVAKAFGADAIFIHDAARPGLDADTLDALLDALVAGNDGAAPAQPVADALWHQRDGYLDQLQDRTDLLRIQTPQAFLSDKIIGAYATLDPQVELADDIAVARHAGLQIVSVAGNERLDKITWPQDFARMSRLLVPPHLPRTGTGIDAHKFSAGDFVTLCGVRIPHSHGLAGHSDADVGWHALADAIYGALSAGDIGYHFPPSEARWKGAASSVFLGHAGEMVRASHGVLNHVDITLICELPKVGPHRAAMIAATAEVLHIRPDQVSIKATTTEGMGFTGRREGIAAQASATILLPDSFRAAAYVEPKL